MPIAYSREGNIGCITLNRPPANSYNADGMLELRAAIEAAGEDNAARVVIVRSALERFFSAGADMSFLIESSLEQNLAMVDQAHETLSLMSRMPKPFIAQIGGHTLGGGMEIALACDMRFGATGRYTLGLPEVTLGIIPGNGGTQRLARLLGVSRALDLMFTGRRLTPEEAHNLGILDRLFPAEELAERTREYAEGLANGASFAIGTIKRAVYEGRTLPLDEALGLERSLLEPVLQGPELKEGISAFKEKRQPNFHAET
ncbi:MAG: enoyl-CoA hydratase/isomerase family protein [Chloroflexaceae bacterium]|jgi:enoyl-CoA hydratase/carnithine racemase|nr:enoyl-CoA hydratase/isomerase family protein [Chloroflexaceae bacterium]